MPRIFAIALAYTAGALLIHLCATLTAVLWACCAGCLCFVVARGWTRSLACIGSGEAARLEGSRRCRSGETWFWNEIEFRILWPVGDARLTSNNRSCVVQVITGGGRILLTGDIEVKAEQALVRDYGTELESSVLVVPHHGSNTSSTLSFLSTVRAKIAVVSAGSHNRYGHPSPEVIDQYERLGIRLLNTARYGEIIIKSGNRRNTVRTWARHHRRFWHS